MDANARNGLLGLGASALLLAVSKAQGEPGTNEGSIAPPVCSAWHRGQGESRPIDLERMKRGYQELKARLSRSLADSMRTELEAVSLKGYNTGLPACRRSETRSSRTDGRIPAEFLGKKLWFARFDGQRRAVLPDLVKDDPEVIVFALGIERLEALSELSRAIGRPVSLAPRELPLALGLRCGPALAVISKEGEVEIHENP